ncbi:DUF3857 domain-containing protein [Flavihumibacter solisilvae]|uniref:DUF3857 domain-containing protein n=1 Tax=Flavihumibacter solisilvae TaxID=1349421 RepID=A0A0C1L1S6_9BACT|nr:DUF3857 domain-containing protein [Flavihumibacter solisilvae]KIC93536.1 hypothetical protein OI18_17460 [Flavihumibacter solisilvae]
MKKLTLSALSLFMLATAYSQAIPAIDRETWKEKPTLHKIDSRFSDESAVILSDIRRIEFIDDAKGSVQAYKTLHKIVHINDDKGIESFNKIYLPVSDNSDLVDIKARAILPGGKIIELDKKNIKDLQEDNTLYKIFAMDGLVKGCEIEYYYTFQMGGSFFGREVMQMGIPVLQAQLSVVSPERLTFDMKTYNSDVKSSDTVLNAKRYSNVEMKDLAGVENEKYSTYTANLARVEFKLSYNAARSATERLFTWNEFAKRVYENYTTFTEKELKKTEKLIAENKWNTLAGEREKIIAVENYIKKNIGTREDFTGEDARNIELILKNKIAGFVGVMRLYGAVYNKLGIDMQFVLAGNRSEFTIDKGFENWNNCDNYLIYFVGQKKFLAPTRIELRYPWIDPYWGNTYALFCKGTTIGSFTTAVAEIKPVPLEDYMHNSSDIIAKAELNATTDTLIINTSHSYRGYSASVYRAVFNFTSAEQQKLYMKDFVKFGTNSEHIVSTGLQNQDFESYSDNKPFVLNATVKASELIEKAGSKLLVKIGDLIGPQVEMYQEKPRQFSMDVAYPHTLGRKIEFVIPEGYVVKNLKELIINDTYQENGQTTMGFVSNYKQEGNRIMIEVMEEYKKTTYPLTQYDAFKKIINAAADFNKIILVLEKKST